MSTPIIPPFRSKTYLKAMPTLTPREAKAVTIKTMRAVHRRLQINPPRLIKRIEVDRDKRAILRALIALEQIF